jgi:hypothetical protein
LQENQYLAFIILQIQRLESRKFSM